VTTFVKLNNNKKKKKKKKAKMTGIDCLNGNVIFFCVSWGKSWDHYSKATAKEPS
jgi:hypothetical protein